jgi:hypothetical protein
MRDAARIVHDVRTIRVVALAIFLMAVAFGYAIPYRDPQRGRAYLWVMGPFLKGAGAIAFLLAYREQPSPRSLLLFAASDGALALVTLWALLRTSARAEP